MFKIGYTTRIKRGNKHKISDFCALQDHRIDIDIAYIEKTFLIYYNFFVNFSQLID